MSNEKDSFDRGVYYDAKKPRENFGEMADNNNRDITIDWVAAYTPMITQALRGKTDAIYKQMVEQ